MLYFWRKENSPFVILTKEESHKLNHLRFFLRQNDKIEVIFVAKIDFKNDEKDIFNTIYRKSYNRELGICARYKFLVNTEVGREVEVDMKSDKQTRWYEVIESSLIETGFDVKISRDSFGRRF